MLVKYLKGALGEKKKKPQLLNPLDATLIAMTTSPENHSLSESEHLQ
jgi:hypothetical protein